MDMTHPLAYHDHVVDIVFVALVNPLGVSHMEM